MKKLQRESEKHKPRSNGSGKKKPKKGLGLKVLSVKVRDIVYGNKATTYKKVASDLLHKMVQNGDLPAVVNSSINFSPYKYFL